MTLHLYFARRFFFSCLGVFAVFFALVYLIELIELGRDLANVDVGFGTLLGLNFLKLPSSMDEMLPLIVILGTIVLFISLARSSEMVITRASGRSAMRALLAPGAVALLIGGFAVTTLGPIASAMQNRFDERLEVYEQGGLSTLSISAEGLWLRQGSAQGQTVIRAGRSNADASVLYAVTFLAYAPDGGPVRRIEASAAQLGDGEWILRNAKVWPLAAGLNPEASAARHEVLRVPSTLTIDRIRDSIGTPAGISIWDMPAYIDQLELAGFSTRRHEVWFQAQIARPLFLLSMMMIAAAFTMRHTRVSNTGVAVLTAVLLGFTLYFIRGFATVLGENGQLPVMLAAWAPPLAFILLALGLFLQAEDG